MEQKYCKCCGFDLEECYGCGFTRDPDEDWVCPNCGADLPNTRAPACLMETETGSLFDPLILIPTQDEILAVYPSL